MQDFEKFGAFYLGRAYDLERRQLQDDLVLYDANDLTTHAVCVGMTGSGKTGLCVALLEEAAIDGVPAIIIDPKGDLPNLLLTFPELDPASFRPWIEEADATRAGMTPDQLAAETARRWRQGLADWGQDPARIERFRSAVDIPVYTPGSNAGLPLAVLKSFAAPAAAALEDTDAIRQRVSSAASGLLALLGMDAEPVRSRDHILISTLLDRAWHERRDVDIPTLIHEIQRPPLKKVGVLDLETFYPAKDRVALAMALNNLVAAPAFSSWMEGDPLDVGALLHTTAGQPRLAIISIAHLSDAERMFFVTILLNEIVAWMRSQPGTASLRALLYMDEVFGYFPPVANPPSKLPMLTLLKQARASGLGIVLATQNPVDLDYKGLANAGTWFLGRLQTGRDKERVLEGLEGATGQSGGKFDRKGMETALAALGSRVFLMNNVHEDRPVVFQTRWVLSYLRGPMTRHQIKTLMDARKAAMAQRPASATGWTPAPVRAPMPAEAIAESQRPVLPPGIDEGFVASARPVADGWRLVYRPALSGQVRLHFARSSPKIDVWEERAFLALLSDPISSSPWDAAARFDGGALQLGQQPDPAGLFASVPSELSQPGRSTTWRKQLQEFCYRTQVLPAWRCPQLRQYSQAGESLRDFRIRLTQLARQQRDLEVDKLRRRYASKFATLKRQIATAEERVRTEASQYHGASLDTVISIGSSLLGALFGRKLASRTNIHRSSMTVRRAGRAARERDDVQAAREKLQRYHEQLADLEQQLAQETRGIDQSSAAGALAIEDVPLRPRKADIEVRALAVAWTPWHVHPAGAAESAFDVLCSATGSAATA